MAQEHLYWDQNELFDEKNEIKNLMRLYLKTLWAESRIGTRLCAGKTLRSNS